MKRGPVSLLLLCSLWLASGFLMAACSGFPSLALRIAPKPPAADTSAASEASTGLTEAEYQSLLDGWREGAAMRQAYLARRQSELNATTAAIGIDRGPRAPASALAEPPDASLSTVLVPNVRGLSYMLASERLQALGLQAQRREETSPTVAAETVLQQEPTPSQEVAPHAVITLVVSLGNQVRLPELYGLPEQEAIRLLAALGLRVPLWGINYQGRNTDIPEPVLHQVCVGCVLSVRPQAGSLLPVGGEVYLAVRSD